MAKEIVYTHELISSDTRIFDRNDSELKKHISETFETIDFIENLLEEKKLKVDGVIHLYGYKVENGGFFDLINLVYYSNEHEFVKNAQIIEVNSKIPKLSLKRY